MGEMACGQRVNTPNVRASLTTDLRYLRYLSKVVCGGRKMSVLTDTADVRWRFNERSKDRHGNGSVAPLKP